MFLDVANFFIVYSWIPETLISNVSDVGIFILQFDLHGSNDKCPDEEKTQQRTAIPKQWSGMWSNAVFN